MNMVDYDSCDVIIYAVSDVEVMYRSTIMQGGQNMQGKLTRLSFH